MYVHNKYCMVHPLQSTISRSSFNSPKKGCAMYAADVAFPLFAKSSLHLVRPAPCAHGFGGASIS